MQERLLPNLGDKASQEWKRQRRSRREFSHSAVLRASLVGDSHIPDPTKHVDNQAHHIVETSNQLGQQILERAGIHPDSSINGVLLPRGENDDAGDASIHSGSHIGSYGDCVTAALWNAVMYAQGRVSNCVESGNFETVNPDIICEEDAETIMKVLAQIRRLLLEVYVPLNNSADRTYGQGDTTGEHILGAFYSRGRMRGAAAVWGL